MRVHGVQQHVSSTTFAWKTRGETKKNDDYVSQLIEISFFFCFPGVVIGEIFSLPIRSKGVALSTASNWFWNAIIGIIVPFLVDYDKADLGVKVFFIWGSTCALCAIFAWLFVPETRGLTLEQVEQVRGTLFFTPNTIHHHHHQKTKAYSSH